jgi:hypothetical protein
MMALWADMNSHWYLPPLVIVVSLVYSATRFEEWRNIIVYAIRWALYILSFLAGAYILLYLVSVNIHPYLFVCLLLVLTAFVLFFNRKDPHSAEES